jgi:hypothetical protein
VSFAQRGDSIFDLALDRETTDLALGKDRPAIADHIELTAAALDQYGGFAEPGFESRGQTDRAGPVVSGFAVKDFDRHRRCRFTIASLAVGQIDEHRGRDH